MSKLFLLLIALLVALTACGGDTAENTNATDDAADQPPTQLVLVVTATPEPATQTAQAANAPTQIVIVITSTPEEAANAGIPRTPDTPRVTATARPTTTPTQAAPPTPLPPLFPTPVEAQVQLAEQVFEHGRMFWLRHNRQIWVMVASEDDPNSGDWFCYNDTFEEGEPELDPNLTPPTATPGLLQPRRGFGKLWRSHPELQEGLGWAITPEFELTSNYTYLAGGSVTNGQYVPGPGEHRLTTLYNENISFFETGTRGDCLGGTWKLTPNPQ